MKIEHRRTQIESNEIYYQVAGAGRPLILIHGLSGSTRWWAGNIQALAQHFRLYVMDLIGFGQSRGRFVLRRASGVLARWMQVLGIERADVVGHSMGGLIAADLASHFPERVDRLVLVDTAAFPFGHNYLRHGFGLAWQLRYVPWSFLPILLTDAWRAGPVNMLRATFEILRADLSADLARITAPTLIIWGERDSLIPIRIGQRLQACIPGAQLCVIRGAGHNPMWDRREEFNRAVLNFLTGASREC